MRRPRRRFPKVGGGGSPRDHDPLHQAVIEGRTRFPSRVFKPDGIRRVLKPGDTSRKYGDLIDVGDWKGFPLYALNLEERKTCPRTCEQWATCYGNNSPFIERFQHGPDLEAQLQVELQTLQYRYDFGFVVRLHGLGDFYSEAYVAKWQGWLEQFPALMIFGYTHWKRGTPIGDALIALRDEQWGRFALRLSDSDEPTRTARVIQDESEAGDAIVCPMHTEVGKRNGVCCASCGLCWRIDRPIAFVAH